jgi:hypothetical protein
MHFRLLNPRVSHHRRIPPMKPEPVNARADRKNPPCSP